MLRHDLLLRTRLIPPRPIRNLLARPQLRARLRQALDYRLTIVQAGTGYGKSSALAGLKSDDALLVWYTLEESDRDVQHFLAYLVAAFRLHLPDATGVATALLNEVGADADIAPTQVIDALINGLSDTLAAPALFVLDDYQTVADAPAIGSLIERLINFLPANLHLLLSTWHPPTFPSLVSWRARGEMLEIGRTDLAFGLDEIAELFQREDGARLERSELKLLHDKTEGWPIVLHLIWQGLRSGATNVHDLLSQGLGSSAALFDYLAREVVDRQPPEIAAFLRETAVLDELTAGACDAVRRDPESGESAPLLRRLLAQDFFVVAVGDEVYRYHHLFHDFLRTLAAADPAGEREGHRRAATWYQGRGDASAAIPHWLAAAEYESAAGAIESIGETALQTGRLNRFAGWIDLLPPDVLAGRPRLQAFLGDVYRLRSQFDGALAWYKQAEQVWRAREDSAGISRALRGQALVYLDTVRSSQAESLLQEALRLTDGTPDREAQARLLQLMAENKLNLGKPEEAEVLRRQAEALRNEAPGNEALDARVKLRTGKLLEARQALEALARVERDTSRTIAEGEIGPPRAHRETVLILSLVEAVMGESDRAHALAEEGVALGERLGSPFITAVGYMRLGHAIQLRGRYAEAAGWYRAAIALGDSLSVRRTRAEAMWGLTRAYGYDGDLESAASAAAEGIEIASDSGDIWLMALARLALGASLQLAGRNEEAIPVLGQALSAFRECHDTFGRAASRLWLALGWLAIANAQHHSPEKKQAGGPNRKRVAPLGGEEPSLEGERGAISRFLTSIRDLLALCENNGFDFLFAAPSLLGPPTERLLVPLLIAARDHGIRPAYVRRLLAALDLPEIRLHPGYKLRVQTLGAFRIWRGDHEIARREWQRDKARQLFQLLLSERIAGGMPRVWGEQWEGRWLQREEIVERLWPDLAPDAATRDFKVALNALIRALEPPQESGSGASERAFFFIEREGAAYRLRADADIWLDATEFEAYCRRGLLGPEDVAAVDALRAALALYGDDFLPDARYDDWAHIPRERLRTLYMRAADRLAMLLVDRGEMQEALEVCQAILREDNCWEHAWQLMIHIHLRQENRSQAMRVLARCTETLQKELGVPPSPETLALLGDANSVTNL